MTNKIKDQIGFHYLLIGIWLHEFILLQLSMFHKKKSITHSIFRTQDDDSIMCGFYCIAFIEYMIAGKTLLDYINLFSTNDYQKKIKR